MRDEYIWQDIHYGERKKKKKRDQAWRVKDDRLEKGDTENRAAVRTRWTVTTDSLARLARKSEGRGLIERAGGRPLRSVGANFHFFHLFAPLGGRFLKSAMAVSGTDWLDFRSVSAFIGCPHSDGGSRHPILTGQSSSRSRPSRSPLSLSLSFAPFLASSSDERGPFRSFARVPLQDGRSPSPGAPTLLFLSFSFSLGTARSPYVTDTIPLE